MRSEPTCIFCGAIIYGSKHPEISPKVGPPCRLEGFNFDPDQWRQRPLDTATFSFTPPDNSEVLWLRSVVKDMIGKLK